MQALVIDDSFLQRTVLAGILSEQGVEVSQSKDGAAALALLAEGLQPDVVLLDLCMPGLSGPDVLAGIRRLCSSKVILVTGEMDPGLEDWAYACGADDYIHRPFNSATVLAALSRVGLRLEAGLQAALAY